MNKCVTNSYAWCKAFLCETCIYVHDEWVTSYLAMNECVMNSYAWCKAFIRETCIYGMSHVVPSDESHHTNQWVTNLYPSINHIAHMNVSRLTQRWITYRFSFSIFLCAMPGFYFSWCNSSRSERHVSAPSALANSLCLRCSVLQCVAVCCSVLQCGAVWCSVLQCVAVCCSVFQCVAIGKFPVFGV